MAHITFLGFPPTVIEAIRPAVEAWLATTDRPISYTAELPNGTTAEIVYLSGSEAEGQITVSAAGSVDAEALTTCARSMGF